MKPSNLLKLLTLVIFISLLTAFLLYKSGRLEKYFDAGKPQSGIKSGAVPENTAQTSYHSDTVPRVTDSVQKLVLSSSKSMVITDRKQPRKDSMKNKPPKIKLSSSKSGIPFKEYDLKYVLDSSKKKSQQ